MNVATERVVDHEPLLQNGCAFCHRAAAAGPHLSRCKRCGQRVCLSCATDWPLVSFFWYWCLRGLCRKCTQRKQQ